MKQNYQIVQKVLFPVRIKFSTEAWLFISMHGNHEKVKVSEVVQGKNKNLFGLVTFRTNGSWKCIILCIIRMRCTGIICKIKCDCTIQSLFDECWNSRRSKKKYREVRELVIDVDESFRRFWSETMSPVSSGAADAQDRSIIQYKSNTFGSIVINSSHIITQKAMKITILLISFIILAVEAKPTIASISQKLSKLRKLGKNKLYRCPPHIHRCRGRTYVDRNLLHYWSPQLHKIDYYSTRIIWKYR